MVQAGWKPQKKYSETVSTREIHFRRVGRKICTVLPDGSIFILLPGGNFNAKHIPANQETQEGENPK